MNKKFTKDLSCWIVTEGIAGTENQCLGLAKNLGLSPIIKHVSMRPPWQWLCPPLTLGAARYGITTQSDRITKPWPDIALCSGRQSIPAALRLKNHTQNKTFVVQIQDPRLPPHLFDMVVAPSHDPVQGNNVIKTTGSLNRITDENLAKAAQEWQPLFSSLPSPLVAVLIGGNSKAYKMSRLATEILSQQLLSLADDGFGILVTASRRTGEENQKILQETLSPHPHIFLWDGESQNPYFGFLGLADTILVTADSVSMISEALTTGKPTYIIPLEGGAQRINQFHKTIIAMDLARPFEGYIDHWQKEKLEETKRVAQIIAQAYERR